MEGKLQNILKLIKEWLNSISGEGLAISREEILRICCEYQPEEVWLEKAIFFPNLRMGQVVCRVTAPHYTTVPMEHVSAEQFVRCYSEACFLLCKLLFKEEKLGVVLPQEAFEKAVHNFFYGGMEVRYKRPEFTGHPFSFGLMLDKSYQLGQKTAFYFTVVGGSLRGKIICFYAPRGSEQALRPELYDLLYGVWNTCWAELPRYKYVALRILVKAIRKFRGNALQAPSLGQILAKKPSWSALCRVGPIDPNKS